MGHDEHHGHEGGHSGPPTKGDLTLVYKIQPIDLVKHNPNIFWPQNPKTPKPQNPYSIKYEFHVQ
jgi:hypothetical protein